MATSRSPAILIAVLAILVVTGSVVLGPMIRRHFKNKQLMTSGVAATATILEVVDTGSRANHNPVVRIR
ncbi:MAG: hypothetical protein HGA98_04535, partial [Deltaproteobacteria bacterium]|nr:hypothetical protein [Deltaproteobacteria bacterium]